MGQGLTQAFSESTLHAYAGSLGALVICVVVSVAGQSAQVSPARLSSGTTSKKLLRRLRTAFACSAALEAYYSAARLQDLHQCCMDTLCMNQGVLQPAATVADSASAAVSTAPHKLSARMHC